MDAAKDAFEAIQRSVGHLVVGLQELKWEDVPQKAKEHLKNNPKMSAFQALSVLLLLVPGLVVGPVLAATLVSVALGRLQVSCASTEH